MPYSKELKGIKLVQDSTSSVVSVHDGIASSLVEVKRALMSVDGVEEVIQSEEYAQLKGKAYDDMSRASPLIHTDVHAIYAEAEARYVDPVGLADILSIEDFAEAEKRVSRHVLDFNRRYGLDGWDYAIAGSCGLFAAMLDLLCVSAPPIPKVDWTQKVDGVFNQAVRKAFNSILTPELSKKLSKRNPIGAADTRTLDQLFDPPRSALYAGNHRLLSAAHDPVFWFIFSVLDMQDGKFTMLDNGGMQRIQSKIPPVEGTVFQLLGKALRHLLSDVNAPSSNNPNNRGIGLPAPFMGLLRMLEGIPVGDPNFGEEIERMYKDGYDFRQFIVTSIPMSIMEVLLRVFYVGKQMKMYNAPFGETMLETMPLRMNPRFRIMLALAYGTSSAVNAGKMYIAPYILNANYASWMGLAWNGFHALKWALVNKHLKLWEEVEGKEIAGLESLVLEMDSLEKRATHLPT